MNTNMTDFSLSIGRVKEKKGNERTRAFVAKKWTGQDNDFTFLLYQ